MGSSFDSESDAPPDNEARSDPRLFDDKIEDYS